MRTIFVALSLLVVLFNCKKDDDYKKSGFLSAGEFLENQDVQHAIRESKFQVHKGNNAPNIVDNYFSKGIVCFSASPNFNVMKGKSDFYTLRIDSQTNSNIRFTFNFDQVNNEGVIYYITGNESSFTIYQESEWVVSLFSGKVKKQRN